MEPRDRPRRPGVLAVEARHGPGVVARVVALCEATPDVESCGFVVARGDHRAVVAVPNVADRFHAASPALHPRTSRDAYVMDPTALLAVHRDLAATGGRIVAVWHSHVDASAAFSVQDRADALVDGVPVLPGAEYIVVALRVGRAVDVRVFRFDGTDFVEETGAPA